MSNNEQKPKIDDNKTCLELIYIPRVSEGVMWSALSQAYSLAFSHA